MKPPAAVVMNMFYTGLGIARSLGEHGIEVIGLTAHPRSYGNYTRYAKICAAPDSREQPEALLEYLLKLGRQFDHAAPIFPTRDDDVLFLDRFREQLQGKFVPVLAGRRALESSLNKWETAIAAEGAGVPSPKCWSISSRADLEEVLPSLAFPCILKPQSAHHWRKAANWRLVGGRKAIAANSREELIAEYENIASVESRALLQEMVPGGDDSLWIAACYLDRDSRLIAGFTAQKLLQVPAGLGTGCIVQTVDRPDLLAKAGALLEAIGYSGIAEVEFKRDASSGVYKLIEINPRPWDQHRLGKACGVDLIHIAYCDLTGTRGPALAKQRTGQKWIAEDVFSFVLLRALVKRTGDFGRLLGMARGERVYPIWSLRDPMPMMAFLALRFVPDLLRTGLHFLRNLFASAPKKGETYGLEQVKN